MMGCYGLPVYEEAKQIVIWHYQWIVLNEFLPTLCGESIVNDILSNGRKVYCPHKNAFIPVEFSVAAYRFGASAPSLVTVVYELMIDDGTLTLSYPPMESDHGGKILDWSNIQHSARLADPSASSCGSSGPQPAWKLAAELAGDFTTSDNGDLFASCSLTEVHGSLYCDLPLSLLKHDRVYRLCTRMKFFWIQPDATVRHLVYATIRSGALTTALLLLTFCVCLG